jgi:cellulose synthase/poly-beta-1,6-N-acetylglucosamine synthase-like glycosyltransferase
MHIDTVPAEYRNVEYAFFLVALAAAVHYSFWIMTRAVPRRQDPSNPSIDVPADACPAISIVVCARNEERSIRDCLDSILRIDYPADKFEIVLVSDWSSDRTFDIICEYADRNSRIIPLRNPPIPFRGPNKGNALDFAVSQCRHSYILITDADCVVPRGWASTVVRQFTPDVGAVFGPVVFEDHGAPLYAVLGNLEMAMFQNFFLAANQRGEYFGLLGGNLAVRAEAIADIGGFGRTDVTVHEDIDWGYRLHHDGRWKLLGFVDEAGWISTRSVTNWPDFLSQRYRWALGTQYEPFRSKRKIYAIHVLALITLIVGSVTIHGVWIAFAGYVTVKTATDAVMLTRGLKAFRPRHWWTLLLFDLTFFQAVLLVPFLFFGWRITWKGRSVVCPERFGKYHR